jgi:coproporphyrinogen III oxidase-like Fe-S oxidoreductase
LSNDVWLSRRRALHDRYFEVARIGDASRLAYLHGPEREWTQAEIAALWDRAAKAPLGGTEPLNCVYIHVPFCKSICHFCNYDRLQPSSPLLLKNWLARVTESLAVIGPAVRPMTFHALYIGGGTPSVLPAKMLGELLDTVDSALNIHPLASRKIEFDPAVMNRERLEVLAAHGFRKLSFGIETLDPDVNERHNRGRQSLQTIERCFAEMRDIGFTDIACDFLLGLAGTTPEGMMEEMETVLRRFQPSWVDIFMLTPTRAYVEKHFGASYEAFWSHMRRFEEVLPRALPELAERTGYRWRGGQGHHMMLTREVRESHGPEDSADATPDPGFFYTALTSGARRPLNLLGLGRSARSIIFGRAAFAARDPQDDPAMAGPAEYAGHEIDIADEARSFLVHDLRDKEVVDRAEFRRIFGADVTEILPAALAGWEADGVAHLEETQLRFTPQDRRARIRSLLWLVPEEAIEFDLAHFGQLELTPTGVTQLASALDVGVALSGGHRFAGVDGTRLLLRTAGGAILRLRIAPGLSDGAALRLVLETPPPAAETDSLRRAVAQLRMALTQQHQRQSRRPAAGHKSAGNPASRSAI